MKIGIAFDLKPKSPLPPGAPDDLHEEFDSPVTIRAIADVIQSMGHVPIELGNGKELLHKLLDDPPDLVFNLAEGSGTSRNREARVPAVCEMLGIPHTGSDVLTLALCLDKEMCRRVVREADIRIPDGLFITFGNEGYDGDYHEFPGMVTESGLNVPLIAKPACEGSSKGIRSKCLIERLEDVGPTVVSLWRDYKQGILLEEFISGEEVTVGILGNDPPRIIGCMQVVPKQDASRFVYSLEVKRDWEDKIYYETPPKMPPEAIRAVENAALEAYDVLGVRDIARIDFRFKDGVPYFLEANPLPGLNPEWSDLIILAKAAGSSHAELVQTVISEAIQRAGLGSI
jgi:D-alanine-D-alanine ligase